MGACALPDSRQTIDADPGRISRVSTRCWTGPAARCPAASSNCSPWPAALCAEPRLILLDEPTEGIQPSIIEEMIETLLGLRRRRPVTMVLVEQNLDFIASLADRILILQKGEVTREIPPEIARDRA